MMDPVQAQRYVHEQQMVALQREMANSMALAGRCIMALARRQAWRAGLAGGGWGEM
jgi:hypothetical protein